jgi:hypothetical protein
MTEVHSYYMSQAVGSGQLAAPPELIEVYLMEKFHWTPMQIDEIPMHRLNKLFFVMQQKENSESSVRQVMAQKAETKKPKKRK